MTDPYVGKLTYFRVYSGQIKAGDRVLNTTNGKTERLGRILEMHANHREERRRSARGDRCRRRAQVHDDGRHARPPSAPIVLESMSFPDPVISVAIEPKTKADQDKLGAALQRLTEEDPTFRVSSDEETGQTLIAGMGELHLEIIVDRLLREFRVDGNVGRPQVAYRETISRPAEKIQGRSFARPGFRSVRRRHHQPLPARARRRLRVRGQDRRRQDPQEYIPAVDAGIEEAMSSGILAGFPVVDIRVELVDGSYHDVDSSERAFKIAGSMAFKEGMKRAKPKLLEPVMSVEVVTPEDFLGDVIGNLNGRRGRIEQIEPVGGSQSGSSQSIRASVPLAEMFGYATDLRSMTQGRATFSMQFDRYEQVPVTIAEALVASDKPA